MRKVIPVLLLCIISWQGYGQAEERILYVVDSIAIIEDPQEDEGAIDEADIETITVVTDKAEMKKYGYADQDKIIFIITREYVKRPPELKRIPTTKKMYTRAHLWYFQEDTPYSGPFIDYYLNGKKEEEGNFKNGKVDGLNKTYFPDGKVAFYSTYVDGIENGDSKEYFINGQVRQEGVFKNGKEDGLWKEWYSTGKLKRQTQFNDGEIVLSKDENKFYSLFNKGIELFNEGNYTMAIKNYNKAIELNPDYNEVYLHRSRAYLYDLKFDESLADCDKAIALEPLYKEAFSNRGFVRLRKYELKNSRTLSKGNGVTVLAAKDKVDIPQDELERMCADLNTGYQLGDKKPMILDAIKNYCQ